MSLDVTLYAMRRTGVYDANITHNLNKMAEAAGLYEYLWRPEEKGIYKAVQLTEPLSDGLLKLETSPDYFKTFNPENAWGSYDDLVNFVRAYLKACRENPDAEIEVSR